ncbi:hypothetical protein [Massilia scottii]|uniref:hypothetical protein n=1 Tax=Massilia scottii TaxID=3057166 RepID=UPI0027969841|nr:hypothetical protein [Massilia sp. CCM 9029]MDQ1835590.1 hypothetical protein [Massilia sp. CCM 9029]
MTKQNLKIYGYESAEFETLLELREVTFSINAEQAELIGEFFLKCARDMTENPDWEHKHYDGAGPVDLIVYKS